MNTNLDDVNVENNEAASRFEARVDGELAVVEYVREEGSIAFTHTLVPPVLEGRGLGSKLARTALDYARAEHLAVIPRCAFIADFIAQHAEYQTLVHPEYRQ